jgi:methyl-accepting chemotaxis protein
MYERITNSHHAATI